MVCWKEKANVESASLVLAAHVQLICQPGNDSWQIIYCHWSLQVLVIASREGYPNIFSPRVVIGALGLDIQSVVTGGCVLLCFLLINKLPYFLFTLTDPKKVIYLAEEFHRRNLVLAGHEHPTSIVLITNFI